MIDLLSFLNDGKKQNGNIWIGTMTLGGFSLFLLSHFPNCKHRHTQKVTLTVELNVHLATLSNPFPCYSMQPCPKQAVLHAMMNPTTTTQRLGRRKEK